MQICLSLIAEVIKQLPAWPTHTHTVSDHPVQPHSSQKHTKTFGRCEWLSVEYGRGPELLCSLQFHVGLHICQL